MAKGKKRDTMLRPRREVSVTVTSGPPIFSSTIAPISYFDRCLVPAYHYFVSDSYLCPSSCLSSNRVSIHVILYMSRSAQHRYRCPVYLFTFTYDYLPPRLPFALTLCPYHCFVSGLCTHVFTYKTRSIPVCISLT